jgi:hypothetical protein
MAANVIPGLNPYFSKIGTGLKKAKVRTKRHDTVSVRFSVDYGGEEFSTDLRPEIQT